MAIWGLAEQERCAARGNLSPTALRCWTPPLPVAVQNSNSFYSVSKKENQGGDFFASFVGYCWSGLLTSIYIYFLQYSLWCLSHCRCSKFPMSCARYNFLNYVGTQFLVYDLEQMRKALGAAKLSIYGYSYGTSAAGMWLTHRTQGMIFRKEWGGG